MSKAVKPTFLSVKVTNFYLLIVCFTLRSGQGRLGKTELQQRHALKFHFLKYFANQIDIRPTQLLNATGIEGGIHDSQVLKYQPSVTSRLFFWYLMIINGTK